MRRRQRFDAALDLFRQLIHLFGPARGQAHDRRQHREEVVGTMPQFVRHAVVFDDSLARGQQFGNVPLRPEEIFEFAIRIVDRADMHCVPESGAVLAIIQNVDDRIDLPVHRFPQPGDRGLLGLLALQEPAIASDDLVDRVAGQFDEGFVAIDDRAIGLMGIGNALRHPRLRGGLEKQLVGIQAQ